MSMTKKLMFLFFVVAFFVAPVFVECNPSDNVLGAKEVKKTVDAPKVEVADADVATYVSDIFVRTAPRALGFALSRYHSYFGNDCDSIFDFQVTPFYNYLTYTGSDKKELAAYSNFHMLGGYVQGHLNYCDWYIDVNGAFGYQKQKDFANDKAIKSVDFSDFGLENLNAKLGYNYYCDEDMQLSIYVFGGGLFPTKVESKVVDRVAKAIDSVSFNKDLQYKAPYVGSLNYRLGFGLDGAVSLYECADSHLAFMFDGQYYYSFLSKLNDKYSFNKIIENKDPQTIENVTLKFAPRYTLSFWGALHYAYCNWNFEVGSVFSGSFGQSLKAEDKDGNELITQEIMEKALDQGVVNVPRVTKFNVQPYIATSYNTEIAGYPVTFGLGVGYEYNSYHRAKEALDDRALHGVSAWATAAISF